MKIYPQFHGNNAAHGIVWATQDDTIKENVKNYELHDPQPGKFEIFTFEHIAIVTFGLKNYDGTVMFLVTLDADIEAFHKSQGDGVSAFLPVLRKAWLAIHLAAKGKSLEDEVQDVGLAV